MKQVNQTHSIASIYLLIAALSSVCSAPAIAQIDEITVTAQKRFEDIQDVPISISVFSGDFIEESGINTIQDLGAYTPNLSLTQSSQVANNRIIIRGVGSVGNSAIEPSVAVFIDGVYYPRPSSVVGSLTDLEAVEVLRGPQGTLFGRNASMGALNIRTRKPSDEFEGQIRGSYGSDNAARVSGSVSGPISETVGGRLSFQYSDRDGYGTNTFTDAGNSTEVGAWEDATVRGKFYFTPTDDLDITLSIDYSEVKNGGPVVEVISDTVLPAYGPTISAILSPTGPFAPSGQTPELLNGFDYEINQDHRDKADDKQWGISGDINWSIGEHTIRSITAFRDWNNDTFESALRLPADLFNRVTTYEVQSVSQELQIISPVGERIEYVAGVYYYSEDYKIDQNFELGADFCAPAIPNLISARVAQTAIPALAAGIAAFLPDPSLAATIAGAIVTGAITDGPTLDGAFGLPAGTGVALLGAAAAAGAPAGIAPGAGAAASAGCLAAEASGLPAVGTQFQQDVESIAVFAQATFNVSDEFRLTGGVRYTRDDKKGSFVSIINNPIVAPGSATNPFGVDLRAPENRPDLRFEENKITWMVNAAYDITNDAMVFGSYSTGFKSGGFNSDGFNSLGIARGAPREFDSEEVDNFEFGVKSTLFDNRVRANLSYFHTKISNYQDRQFDGVNFLVQNAGKLTQQGLEADIQAQPVDQLFMLFGLSYLHSDFNTFTDATNLPAVVAAAKAVGAIPPSRDLTGFRNHFSPKWQTSFVAEWSDALPNTNLGWFLRGEFQYTDDQNLGAETNQNPQSIQKGYEVFNARAGIRGADEKWELSAFVRNLGDKNYCQAIFNQPIGMTLGLVDRTGGTGGGMQRCVLGAPRTWGVEAAYRF
ncbi:MAG: iron complex outermembrane receptor protein [Gammaproteobacteria bacterium]|jgi:iron complex outermembrane receptor protein